MNTLSVLKALADSSFPTNGTKAITATTLRNFLKTVLDGVFTPAGTVKIWPGYTVPTGWALCDGADYVIADYGDLFAALGGYNSPYGVGTTTFKVPHVLAATGVIQYGISKYYGIFDGQTDYTIGDVLTAETPVGGVAATFKVTAIGNNFAIQLLTHGRGYVAGTYTLSGGTGDGASVVITSAYGLGTTAGEETHTLSVTEMPSHTHLQNAHNHGIAMKTNAGAAPVAQTGAYSGTDITGNTTNPATATNQNTGGGQAHNNMPPVIGMNYIIKLY